MNKLGTYKEGRYTGINPEVDAEWNQLRLEEEWLLILRDALIKIVLLAARDKINQIQGIVKLNATSDPPAI